MINTSRKRVFANILNDIHGQMSQKMQNEINSNNLKKKAEDIEIFLKEIKTTAYSLRNAKNKYKIMEEVNQQLLEVISDAHDELLTQHAVHSDYRLFQRKHNNKYKTALADDIFEEQFAALVASLISKNTNQNLSMDIVLTGQNKTNIDILKNKDTHLEILNITNEAAMRQAAKMKIYTPQKTKGLVYKISSEPGKTDVSVPSIKIEGDGNELVNSFLQAISGMNFSLKNYSDYKWDKEKGKLVQRENMKLHLGDTLLPKAILGSLTEVLDQESAIAVYMRGFKILSGQAKKSKTPQEIVSKHFAHLRFIFELRGSGLTDEGGQSKIVDFLIWNDPTSEQIAVRSTADIILSRWQYYSSLYSDISMVAHSLLF